MKEFEKGDTVYWGTLKGEVTEQRNNNTYSSTIVKFNREGNVSFTKDGRYLKNTPVVLSHFPYEMKMKKVEQVIAKDTPVWFRDDENEFWGYGYYSHFKNGKHYIFEQSKKSTESISFNFLKIVTTENPLK